MKANKRIKNDKGASNSVSFILIIGFIMLLLMSFIDVGMYFNVKNQMHSAAEGGARAVALYGGTNTVITRRFGVDPELTLKESIQATFQDIEFDDTGNLVLNTNPIVDFITASCSPENDVRVGGSVSCEIEYRYKGIMDTLGLFAVGGSTVTITGTSVSEVWADN